LNRNPFSTFFGGDGEEGTPVPIPNTEVKLFSADGTAREAVWESRTPPKISFPKEIVFFMWRCVRNIDGRSNRSGPTTDDLETAVFQTLKTGKGDHAKSGSDARVVFLQHKSVIITYPVKTEGRTIAAGGLESPLIPIYQDFRQDTKNRFDFRRY
jgi:hypothetical protein